MTKVIAFVPARMGSSRFPGKPLADICGIPMVEHVRLRAKRCRVFDKVVVATCDKEIEDLVIRNGGEAIMTSPEHPGCIDRVAEACRGYSEEIVVVVQGDEPLIEPKIFESLVEPFSDPSILCTNLINPITDTIDYQNPNVVKVACDINKNFLYLSREPIPSVQKSNKEQVKNHIFKQLGMIAFRKNFLLEFAHLPRTPLEIIESVDILRAVEHGIKVRSIITPFISIGVDTPQDLERVKEIMKNDSLFNEYSTT